MTNKNNGNLFSISRQLFESEIWLTKPATWKIIWIYIIGRVNHTDSKMYKRGEGFFIFSREKEAIGIDITDNIIKKCLAFLREKQMIRTSRSTRGTVLKVLNYNRLQSQIKISRTSKRTTEERQKNDRRTPICNNDNNVNNVNNVNKRTILQKWLNYRKSLKKPIKVEETLTALIEKFNSEPIEKIEWTVNQSIENGYQGLFWDKYSNQSPRLGTKRTHIDKGNEYENL